MDVQQQLRRLAVRLSTDDEDLRHTLLDVSDDLLAVFADDNLFPERLRSEVCELRDDVQEAQPRFRSHRSTSSLFDREGLGAAGRKRARVIAQRVIAVSKSLDRDRGGTRGKH